MEDAPAVTANANDARIDWTEAGHACSARWRSEAGLPPPRRVVVADDTMRADEAWRLACEGTALLWRGDYQNARQLLQAMGRRADRGGRRGQAAATITEAFHRHRMAQAQRARTLGMLLVPVAAGGVVPLRRAPEVVAACEAAWGDTGEASVVALRELLGLIGAYQWRRNGVPIAALGGRRIHPHYGVFAPVRGEYLDLVAEASLPSGALAFDIGTGSGVLAAILAARGLARVVATDTSPRALACARDNLARLGLADRVEVRACDLFPDGRAALVVCNPPWLPGKPSSLLDQAIYDPGSRMLRGFLAGLTAHLVAGGEGWLVLSDLAERLGLRSRESLLDWIEAAGLRVLDRLDTRPRHGKAQDASDPLHAARRDEVTSLWRLAAGG